MAVVFGVNRLAGNAVLGSAAASPTLVAGIQSSLSLTASLTKPSVILAASFAASVQATSVLTASTQTLAASFVAGQTLSATLTKPNSSLVLSISCNSTASASLTGSTTFQASVSCRSVVSASLTAIANTGLKSTFSISPNLYSNLYATMTEFEFQDWLDDQNAVRVVLVEVVANVAGVDTVRYMSTTNFNTLPSDNLNPNLHYEPILKTGINFNERLSLTTDASLSVGDIELDNTNGVRDTWLNDIWVNQPVKAYIGDVRWPRSIFKLIFNGVIADINSRDSEVLNLKLQDKLQRLNTPVSEIKLSDTHPGDVTPNKDALIPLAFGEVHNITPLFITPATLEYQIHNGAVEGTFEVRDNGIPVAATVANATGKFTLPATPAGSVTVSLQGDKPTTYSNTVANLVKRIVTGFGKPSDRFTSADLDLPSFASFNAAHLQPVGIYLQDRVNVLSACKQLASSIGSQLVMSRDGLLSIVQLAFPPTGPVTNIDSSQIILNSLKLVNKTDVVAAVKLNFCKNYTVQAGLLTAIPAQHKDLYSQEWLTVTAKDATVQAAYKLNVEPVAEDTYLLTYQDANSEAARRLALYKTPRLTYGFDATSSLMSLKLGQTVKLTHPRYGLASGVNGMVTALTPDWITCRVYVEVTI
jgi:hypothetical protein